MSHARPFDHNPDPTNIPDTIRKAVWDENENARLVMMARKMAFDAGYDIDTNTDIGKEAFERFHELDIFLTVIMDRLVGQAEMLDAMACHVGSRAAR